MQKGEILLFGPQKWLLFRGYIIALYTLKLANIFQIQGKKRHSKQNQTIKQDHN